MALPKMVEDQSLNDTVELLRYWRWSHRVEGDTALTRKMIGILEETIEKATGSKA